MYVFQSLSINPFNLRVLFRIKRMISQEKSGVGSGHKAGGSARVQENGPCDILTKYSAAVGGWGA